MALPLEQQRGDGGIDPPGEADDDPRPLAWTMVRVEARRLEQRAATGRRSRRASVGGASDLRHVHGPILPKTPDSAGFDRDAVI